MAEGRALFQCAALSIWFYQILMNPPLKVRGGEGEL